MLKVFLGFLVSVVVLQSSVYALSGFPKAYATSANIVISQVQAGGVGAATQEFIVLYNNSQEDVDITAWCITNKNNAIVVCFGEPLGKELFLPAHKHAVIMSSSLAITAAPGAVTWTYAPISQSSGSITGGSDTISLLDSTGALVDRQSWTASIAGGMQFERHGSGSPVIYQDTDTSSDWSITAPGTLPIDETETTTVTIDMCRNIDDIQLIVPDGMELNTAGECVPRVITKLDITEVLPNASGSDDGHEFIEIYNPNDMPVELAGYQLYVGPQLEAKYDFPTNLVISGRTYVSFTNNDIPYSLLNTSSRVMLALRNGIVVSEVPAYTNPKDDMSWAIVDGAWQYTNLPTPGLANLISVESDDSVDVSDSTLQPCATNQYRNPLTNRCRLIVSTVGTVTPCKDGQYRSEQTNRCRNISSDVKVVAACDEGEERNLVTNRCRKIVATTEPAACKVGQERNPDTNRCRTVTKMPSANYGVRTTETKNGGSLYVWATVGGILLLAVGYAIWEWRVEIKHFLRRYRMVILRFARIRK
jgi:hypothetical protein